jgi:hypothetical protein
VSQADYSRKAFRAVREREDAAREPDRQGFLLADIPVDAEMDDATITVFNGQKFEAYDRWLAKRPVATEESVHHELQSPAQGKMGCDKRAPVDEIEQEGLWGDE